MASTVPDNSYTWRTNSYLRSINTPYGEPRRVDWRISKYDDKSPWTPWSFRITENNYLHLCRIVYSVYFRLRWSFELYPVILILQNNLLNCSFFMILITVCLTTCGETIQWDNILKNSFSERIRNTIQLISI